MSDEETEWEEWNVRERFEDKVDKESDNPCWVWTGASNDQGYGRLQVGDRLAYAHRVSYQLFVGDIPEGGQINHECHNEPCVNPDHLYAGTQSENVSDAINRGSFSQLNISGESHGVSKLTEKQVNEIRALYETTDHTQYSLAEEYDVSRGTVQAIVNWETWTHLDPINEQ